MDQVNALLHAPDPDAKSELEPEHQSANIVTMWKHPNLVVLLFAQAYLWSINAMVYVGLSYNTHNFGSNVYIGIVKKKS